jgi:hypothetical protein
MKSMIVAAAFMLLGLTTIAAAQSASRRTIDLDAGEVTKPIRGLPR